MPSIADIPLKSGLYVVSVPIGNLQDITIRALETLKKLDKIYCEDTRVTKKLLDLHQILASELYRCDDQVQAQTIDTIKQDIQNGLAVGLVSDAGTPLISDPGYMVVAALRQQNLPIFPIPGVCAAISALSVSGLPTHQFRFMGFIPKKQKQRLLLIDMMQQTPDSFVFYERPDRILDFIALFPESLQAAECFIAREMTKRHEEYILSSIQELPDKLANMSIKGEAVLIIATHNSQTAQEIDLSVKVSELLLQGKTPKDISQDTYLRQYASRNDLYALAQSLKNV